MPPKKKETDTTRKSSTHATQPPSSKPMEPEINVQSRPVSSNAAHMGPATSNTELKNFHPENVALPTKESALMNAEQLMLEALQQLQMIYNDACKVKTEQITIKQTTFEAIGQRIQQAHEQVKLARSGENKPENTILETLAQIQSSIVNLEKKYNNIESTMAEAPNTYAEIIKSTVTPKNAKVEVRTERRKQREHLRREQERYEITLTTKEADAATQQSIFAKSAKEITEQCQKAVNHAYENKSKTLKIRGISKLANGICIQCDSLMDAQSLGHEVNVDWNKAFKGLKKHDPNHGVVVHGVPIAVLDLRKMTDNEFIKQLEKANGMNPGTITKITPLRRRNNQDSDKEKLHYSIVVYTNEKYAANEVIMSGFYIEYYHYATVARFTPQYQITQCFNCSDYGHRAANCKRHTRCGKCGEGHNTRECDSTTAHCFQCKGPHEAWHPQCPARVAEVKRLDELVGNCPLLFE